jgi:hypothetical protein
MAINSYYSGSGWRDQILESLTDIRQTLDDESLKVSSGLNSENFAGIGSNVKTDIALHDKFDSLNGYGDIIDNAQTEINFVSQTLSSTDTLLSTVGSGPLSLAGGTDAVARTTVKSSLQSEFESLTSYLRTQDQTGYIFGGAVGPNPPVATSDLMLNGSSTQAGLTQLFNERYAADAGANGLGRLVITNQAANVAISEESAGLPFGMKLSTISSGLANATVNQAAGSPPT